MIDDPNFSQFPDLPLLSMDTDSLVFISRLAAGVKRSLYSWMAKVSVIPAMCAATKRMKTLSSLNSTLRFATLDRSNSAAPSRQQVLL